ncbi:MAG: endo alpha-1,4 polygalactosaminidase, partial [Deltaproteobacteria bacterium]|nr:endo alpha-1,4 polygalactosaminidase [Deltaproteobacteria bacterium]
DAKNIIVRNNIFSQNLLFQISNEAQLSETNLTVDHNLIHDYTGEYEYEIRGTDYVEGDPKFVNPSGSDFHLQGNSPAINQGASTDAPNDDYDRNQRPQGAGYDIGAYEYIVSISTKDKKTYFPHIASDGTWETEICVINTSSEQNLNGDLKTYNNSGQLVASKSITLGSNARREIIIGDDFSNPKDIGYIIFESDSQSVSGYTKFYIKGKYRVAIPAASDVNTGDIYVSHIASDSNWTTGISILNTTSSSKDLTIEFDDGTTKSKSISANEHQAFTIRELFDGNPQQGINSAVIKNGGGIVGLEIFGSTEDSGTNYLSGILLKDDTTTNIYYPHIASDTTWGTGVVAYNPSTTSCNLTITPYKDDGTSLSSQTIPLAGQEKYMGTPEILNLPDGTAWFSILASNPITGFELFSTKDGNQLGGYTGVSISSKNGVFAKIEKDGGTGIAFVNIENASAVVTMTAYDDSGNVIATETLNLNAHGKVVDVPENLFSKDISTATYIAYSSDKEVVGFQLNVSSDDMMLDALPGAAPSVTNLSRIASLQAAMTWMYQIQDLDIEGAVDALAATNYPLLVLEPGHNFKDFPYDTSNIVQSLKTTPDGQYRLLLAYIDIGQAEDYRDYWDDNWIAPTATQRGTPDFLITIDPDGWSGNYPVAYWRQEWKNIYLGNSGIVAKLARLGFDGVYLDWVEAYDDDTVKVVADEDGVNPEVEMIQFIEEIMQAGRTVTEGFLVVPQNAPHLINTDPKRYVATINALAVEDTWFHGDGDADWNDPRAGDLHERHDEPGWTTNDRLKEYEKYIERGLPVFSVDYCISEENTAQVYRDARTAGLRPLVTRVSLSRLTETPPDAY